MPGAGALGFAEVPPTAIVARGRHLKQNPALDKTQSRAIGTARSQSYSQQEVVLKSFFPRLVLVLLVLSVVQIARAQTSTEALPDGRAAATAARTDLPDLVRRVKPSVVSVLTYDAKGEPLISGTGFFVRPGEVLTNMHVIKGAHRVEIHTLEGKGRTYPVAGALAVDDEADLALLKVDLPADRSKPLMMTTSLPDEGEQIFVIGNPLRLEGSVSDGIVSAIREVPDLGRIIQITAPVSHGNSGSPLFNMRGEVIGIVTVKVTNGQNINLALGAARIAALQAGKLMAFDQIGSKSRSNQPEALADLWYRGGIDSLWLGNYDSALNYFETAANRNPRRAETWIQIGYCKVKQGRNDEAIHAYQRALTLRPNSADAHNKLGDAYFFAGRLEEAIASYKEAVRVQPDQPEAYYNLGLAYLEIGDRATALAQSRLLESIDPDLNKRLLAELQR